MRLPRLDRTLFGFGLVIVSAVGLVGGVLGLVYTARISTTLVTDIDLALEAVLTSLELTGDTLVLADEALGSTATAVEAARVTTLGVQQTVGSTDSLLTSLGDTLGTELPDVIRSTQQSLDTAEESARGLEDVLLGLNAVSSFTGVTYEPDVSLADSLAGMNTSLAALPESFTAIADELSGVQENTATVQSDLGGVAGSLSGIVTTLGDTRELIDTYNTRLDDLTGTIGQLQRQMDRQVRTVRIVIYFLLVWFTLAQIGLLYQGWEMVRFDHARLARRVRELEKIVSAMQPPAAPEDEDSEEPAAGEDDGDEDEQSAERDADLDDAADD